MILAQTEQLDLNECEYFSPLGVSFCEGSLHKFFQFPPGAPRIQLVAHDRPAKDRVMVDCRCTIYSAVFVDGKRVVLMFNTKQLAISVCENNSGKPIYVELYYWEE